MWQRRVAFYEFDDYRVDVARRTLARNGVRVLLVPKTFDLLRLFLERPHRTLSYAELIAALWPMDPAVTERNLQNLREQVKRLRTALGREQVYVNTVATKGYEFVADVRALRRSPWMLWSPALATAGGAIVMLIISTFRPATVLAEIDLTSNAPDDPVTAQAISPDGRYLVYADRGGIELEDIDPSPHNRRSITVAGLSEVSSLSWSPDGLSIFIAGKHAGSDRSGLWQVARSGGTARYIHDNVSRAALSPDGTRIAFVDDSGRRAGIMAANGDDARIVVDGEAGDRIREIAWSPDGSRMLLGKLHLAAFDLQVTIESVDDRGHVVRIVQPNPSLRSSCITPDGRLLYAVAEPPPNQNTTSLWEYAHVDFVKGRVSKPRKIATWRGSAIQDLSVSMNGSRLVFLKGPYQSDVYVADLESPGVLRGGSVRRLTGVNTNELPTAWSPDGTSVLFHSDRDGKWDVWKQRLDGSSADLIVASPTDNRGSRISPDGRWVFFAARARDNQIWKWGSPATLIRTTMTGDSPRALFSSRMIFSVRCPRAASRPCVMGERSLMGTFTFSVLDPESGRGAVLSTVDSDAPLDQNNWDLSPDGTQIAIVMKEIRGSSRIRVTPVNGGASRDVTVKDRIGFQSIDWSADGRGWYISSSSADGAEILFVDPDGGAKTIREQPRSFGTWAIPSPDGKRLAILEWSAASNVWMINRF